MAKIGNNVTDSQVRDIVNNQININHLGDTINNNQKTEIVNLLLQIRDSGALKNDNFKKQADLLSKNIQNGAKNIFNKLNTQQNRNFFEQLLANIANFFSQLFNSIAKLFSGK